MDEILHVYENDVIDYVVATSVEEAKELMSKAFDDVEEYLETEYIQVPDDKELTINSDDEGLLTHTCAEWCKINGKGFLCSTEY
jgi:hypothetical protein